MYSILAQTKNYFKINFLLLALEPEKCYFRIYVCVSLFKTL